jgi:hypothetical protein
MNDFEMLAPLRQMDPAVPHLAAGPLLETARRRRRLRRLAAGSAGCVVIAGVSIAAVLASSRATPDASNASDANSAPTSYSCGDFVSTGPGAPVVPATAQQCLLAAFHTGNSASLRYSGITMEGDPIITLSVSKRGVTAIVDTTADASGPRVVTTYSCASLELGRTVPQFGTCQTW